MRINSNKIIGIMAVTMGATIFGMGDARADILPAVGSPMVSASGTGTFLFDYDFFVTEAQEVRTGDFFTIYDFAGFVRVDQQPENFSFVVENVSAPVVTNQGTTIPNDNAAVENIRFTYIGGTTIVGGPQSLGTFTLESRFGGLGAPTAFIGRGTDQVTGLPQSNLTNVITPGVEIIPEPGEYAFAAFAGASLLGLVVRARRRAAAAS